MNNDKRADAQQELEAQGFDFRPLDDQDWARLKRHPDAEFIMRSWRPYDDEYELHEASKADMVLLTVIFPAGCRIVHQVRPALGNPLKRVSRHASLTVDQYPQLAGGAL